MTHTMANDARPRRTRRKRVRWADVRAQWPLAVLLAGLLVALGFVLAERWRRGAVVAGGVALVAAALRAVLPEPTARLLVVRSRVFDVVFCVLLGGLILWLAATIDSLGT